MDEKDQFDLKMACPLCGNAEARMTLEAIKCPNPPCANFGGAAPPPTPAPAAPPPEISQPLPESPAPRPEKKPARVPPEEKFDPVANRLEIKYRNHKGQEKSFIGDSATIRASGKHISVRVLPSGERIALAKERILNWADMKAAVPSPMPTSASKKKPASGCGCLILMIFLGLLAFALRHFLR